MTESASFGTVLIDRLTAVVEVRAARLVPSRPPAKLADPFVGRKNSRIAAFLPLRLLAEKAEGLRERFLTVLEVAIENRSVEDFFRGWWELDHATIVAASKDRSRFVPPGTIYAPDPPTSTCPIDTCCRRALIRTYGGT